MTTVVKSVRIRNGSFGKNELPCLACEEGRCRSGLCDRLEGFAKDKVDVSVEWETRSRLSVVLPFVVRVLTLILVGYVCFSAVKIVNAVRGGHQSESGTSLQQ